MNKLNLLLAGFIVLLSSCSKHTNFEGGNSIERKSVVAEMMEVAPPPQYTPKESYNPKLVKKGELTISSNNIEQTKHIIYGFVKRCNGHVMNENLVTNDPFSYYQISVSVQSSQFEQFLVLLDSSKLNVLTKSFSTEDVTMQYVDNTTRLENKKKLEKRYLELLSKTKNITDMLEIEEKLEDIRSDIESRENQMKILDRQIDYSEIHIMIRSESSNLTYEQRSKYSYKLLQGLINGWQGMKAALLILLTIWPLYIVAIIIFYIVRVSRNMKRKQASSN